MNDYKATIGIEVHAALKTKTKVFSRSISSYSGLANTHVNVVDLGYPGTLPTINKEVVNKALLASLALNCNINKIMHFDRKNYFYPDLPKGYQITQNMTPIGYLGYIDIDDKRIRIERLHIEEDTAKSIHDNGKTYLNYNRAGVPLIEIVSSADMHTSSEAMKYLERLKELLFYLDISDCKMEEGSMRADVNVSVSKDDTLGEKCEVKNIGSIKDVGLAIDYEIKRQINMLEDGKKITPQTRKFDANTNTTILMRLKETGNDYRYFPEPDIPYLTITDELIEEASNMLINHPNNRRDLFLSKNILEINVLKLMNNKDLCDYLYSFKDTNLNFVIASNLLLGDIQAYLNKELIKITDTKLTKEKFINLVESLEKKEITSRICKDILLDVLESSLSIKDILNKHNISIMSDEELINIIKETLKENSSLVNDYKNGKINAFKFLVGMVMKKTKGLADPTKVNDILNTLL